MVGASEGDVKISSLKRKWVSKISIYWKNIPGRGNTKYKCKSSVKGATPAECLVSRTIKEVKHRSVYADPEKKRTHVYSKRSTAMSTVNCHVWHSIDQITEKLLLFTYTGPAIVPQIHLACSNLQARDWPQRPECSTHTSAFLRHLPRPAQTFPPLWGLFLTTSTPWFLRLNPHTSRTPLSLLNQNSRLRKIHR